MTPARALAVAIGVACVVFTVAWCRGLSERRLEQKIAANYPVAAAAFVEERKLPGPLYNDFDWGGYLIWRLPRLPVAMDGRTNLHGDARLERSTNTWAGKRGWDSDPELLGARLVIANVKTTLASLLRLHPGFERVYEDGTAVAFVARHAPYSCSRLIEDSLPGHSGSEARR
jgi:hypothetical protein